MSAIDIIEEIKKLPREEQQKIAVYIDNLRSEATGKESAEVSENFKRVADEVFKNNAELFRKLAQ